MAVVSRKGKIEKEILIGGVLLVVGYFVWKRFYSPSVLAEKKCKNAYENPPGGGNIKMPYDSYRKKFCELEPIKEDCDNPQLTFNEKEMCKERNTPGYIHAPLR